MLLEERYRITKTMQRLIKEGHYIGLHSMSHDVKRLYTGDPSTLITEMEQTQNIVQQITKLHTHRSCPLR